MTAAEQPVDPAQLDDVELAASLAHDQWCNAMRRAGWRHGERLDLPGLTHPELLPYAQLPAAAQAVYREGAR